MAQITDATLTTSSLANIVNSEYIHEAVLDANRVPTIGEMLAAMYDASSVRSATYTVTKWVAAEVPTSEAAPKAETDVFAATEQTMSQVQISAAVVGIMKAIGREALQDTVLEGGIVEALVRESVLEMRLQKDEDLLSRITSATNTESFAGLDLTISRFAAAGATFHALNPYVTGRLAFVGDAVQIEDLKADLRSATGAIYGSEFGSSAGDMLAMNVSGLLGTYEGFEMYRGQVPAFDGSNTSGAMLVPGAALGMAMWWDLLFEVEPLPDRVSQNLVLSSRYGTNIINQSNIVEVVSSNS